MRADQKASARAPHERDGLWLSLGLASRCVLAVASAIAPWTGHSVPPQRSQWRWGSADAMNIGSGIVE